MLVSKFYSWRRHNYYLTAKALPVSCPTNKELGSCPSILRISEKLNKLKKATTLFGCGRDGRKMPQAGRGERDTGSWGRDTGSNPGRRCRGPTTLGGRRQRLPGATAQPRAGERPPTASGGAGRNHL